MTLRNRLLAGAAAGTFALTGAFAVPKPASADSTSTALLLGAAAVAGAVIINNVNHKNHQANTITGYLPDGSPVYADGHIVARDGSTYYPNNNGQQVACNGQSCYITGNGAYNGQYGYNGPYNNGPYNNARYNNGRYNQPYAYNGNGQYANNNGRWHRDRDRDRDRDDR